MTLKGMLWYMEKWTSYDFTNSIFFYQYDDDVEVGQTTPIDGDVDEDNSVAPVAPFINQDPVSQNDVGAWKSHHD